MSPVSAIALDNAVARPAGIAGPVVVGVPVSATVVSEVSVVSASVEVIEPVSCRNCAGPASIAPVFGLSRTVAVSSVTAPTLSTTVITGVSLVPVMVTVTVWVAVSVAVPELSFTEMV